MERLIVWIRIYSYLFILNLAFSMSALSDLLKEGARGTQEAKKNSESLSEYHFSMAQAYSSDGDPDKAIEEYKLTLMYDPNSPLVFARLATEYVKKGMLSAAMDSCKEALLKNENYTDARLILAGLYSTSHETTLALKEYDRILKSNPKNEEAIIYKSQVLVEDGKPKEAASFLRRSIKILPESALILFYLARAEQQQEHFKEALLSYKKALELRPGFSQAALSLGYLYEEKQMNAQAVAVYSALFEDAQDLSAASRLATIFLKEEKYKLAIPYLEVIRLSDPEDMNVRVKLGLIHMELKNYDKSISIFKDILEKNPDSDRIHYYLASIYEEMKQPQSAIDQLKLIQSDSKLFVDATLHAAYLLRHVKKISEAKSLMKDSIDKFPKNPKFYLFQATLEDETQNIDEAVSILKKASKLFPEDERLHYYLGTLYERRGNSDDSLQEMESIVKLNPDNVDALNYIAYTWTRRGVRLNDAEKLLRRALGLRPGNGYIQDSWGWYLFTSGILKEAVIELEKAVKLKPKESTILDHLGDAYLRANLREKALLQYTDAIRYAEDEKEKQKILIKTETLKRELAGTSETQLHSHEAK